MIRIIKFENETEENINVILEDMQENYHAQILGIQYYGTRDCYMVTYECEYKIDKKKIVYDHTSMPLDE